MRKYLPQIIQQLTSPPLQLDNKILSPSRFLNKRAMIRQIKKLWGYHSEHDIDRQIAYSYNYLKDAIKANNSPMALRFLSLDLYQQYLNYNQCFQIEDSISNISIINCGKVKNEATGIEWFHISAVIKHFNTQYSYGLERRIYTQNDQFHDISPTRKWCFNKLPLKSPTQKQQSPPRQIQ